MYPATTHAAPSLEHHLRMRPCADPLPWSLLKSTVQLALAASAVTLVIEGGRAPVMALSYVATALLLMGAIVIADRMRFQLIDPSIELVEVVVPESLSEIVPEVVQQPIITAPIPLHVMIPEPVEVT